MTNEEAMYIISECFLNSAANMAESEMIKEHFNSPGRRTQLTDQYLREICYAVIDRVLDGR